MTRLIFYSIGLISYLKRSGEEEKVKVKYQRQRKDWEQSPELKAALIRQSSIDPETIFGKVLPLNLDGWFLKKI